MNRDDFYLAVGMAICLASATGVVWLIVAFVRAVVAHGLR